MPDPIFDHPRLAAIYDVFDSDRGDLDAYRAVVAELGARHVLDVGCGTGSLAVQLADAGLTVTGVDPSAASLAVARAKRSTGVTWLDGDATGLPPLGADLATMTGNVAQVFLTDDDWAATLHGIHRALRPGGWFVFETRRPQARGWERWDDQDETRDVPGLGPVRQQCAVISVRLPLVSFRFTYSFPDGVTLVSDSTLRFRDRAELEASLAAAGFEVVDVRDAPDRPGLEYVFLTRARP